MEEERILFDKLETMLNNKEYRELKKSLIEINVADIAEFICELSESKALMVFRMLPKELATDVFACLDYDIQEHIITSITDKEIGSIIEELYVDDAVDMLEELPASVVKRVMQNATSNTRNLINEFLKYPENSAGSIMTAEYIGLKKDMTVAESFAYIRKHGLDKETIYICYVMDNKRKLLGVVTVKDLLMSPYETLIEDIMDKNVIKAITTSDREEVVDLFNKYDLITMPVVDNEQRLVGIITIDDIVDVMEEEATEDFEKMAAMLPSERPYLKTSVFELVRNRIPWLLVLMFSSMSTGLILTKYENAFAAVPLLVSFVPMITDTGGNAGSQSSTMVIRGMAIGDIEPIDTLRVLWKEFRVAIVCGLILSLANFIRLVIQYPHNLNMCITVVLSVYVTVIVSKITGSILPILAKKAKLDPAVMAAPLITTIVDTISLVIYFNFAVLLLNI